MKFFLWFFRSVLVIAVLFSFSGIVWFLISSTAKTALRIQKSVEERSWLIDYPFFGIKLGDEIGNIPNGYRHDKDVEYSSPYEEIEKVQIFPYIDLDDIHEIEQNRRIYALVFYFKEANYNNFLRIINTFEQKHNIKEKYNQELPGKQARYAINLDGKEVLVEITYIKYADRDVLFIKYDHKDIIEMINKKQEEERKRENERIETQEEFNSLKKNI